MFAAGRIVNLKSARSQIIGAITMGIGAALMEDALVDKRFGYFVNRDLAEHRVPVHADIPEQDVLFLEEVDDKSSPMKAKGVGELGICGIGAAVANAVYNATGVRIRDYRLRWTRSSPVCAPEPAGDGKAQRVLGRAGSIPRARSRPSIASSSRLAWGLSIDGSPSKR